MQMQTTQKAKAAFERADGPPVAAISKCRAAAARAAATSEQTPTQHRTQYYCLCCFLPASEAAAATRGQTIIHRQGQQKSRDASTAKRRTNIRQTQK